ncbi:MAG: hypothetical protein JWR15_3051, partial [Prosthecobacter sp.]|nr:hypothetical protein [Prosthecobacter sp.]
RATRPHKKISMRQPLLGDGIAQRPYDVVLAENVCEGLGAVFAGKNLVTHPFRLTKRIVEATGTLNNEH